MGRLRPSAKVVTLRARPSGPKSERILTLSRPGMSLAGYGYSTVLVTQSRPLASKAMLIGFWMSGSAATSWASNPGGRRKVARSAAGDWCSVVATYGGSAARAAKPQAKMTNVRKGGRHGGAPAGGGGGGAAPGK